MAAKTSVGWFVGQGVVFLAILTTIYIAFPPESRWKIIGVTVAISIVALLGGRARWVGLWTTWPAMSGPPK